MTSNKSELEDLKKTLLLFKPLKIKWDKRPRPQFHADGSREVSEILFTWSKGCIMHGTARVGSCMAAHGSW
ncbi:hypothetical protein CCACVL1_15020, partial [Corchorus capsularis]